MEAGRFTNDNDTPVRVSLYKEDRYIGKATLDWQADRYNRIKFGGELTQYNIDQYSFRLTDKFFSDAYKEKPIRWNGFVEDRLDLGDVVVVGGLRYDYYDTKASRPFVTGQDGSRYAFPRISTNPEFDLNNPTSVLVPDESHSYLSPHVQVSFPVTDRTNFRLSYSHQVQAPDFGLVLGGINIDLDFTNTNQVFGSDLDFGKTIAFEFGIRHAFSDDMVLDIAAYNKDIVSDPAARLVSLFDPAVNRINDFRILTNLDFGNVRGLDIRLDRRFGNYFNGTIGYSYQQAKNTGSDPFTYINYGSRIVNQVGGTNGAQPPPQGILPTDDSRPHALTGAFSVTFPADFQQGTRDRYRAQELQRLHHVPVHQRHRLHQVRRQQRRAEHSLDRELRAALPRRPQHPAAAVLQGPQRPLHQGLRARRSRPDRVSGRPQPAELPEHPAGLRGERRHPERR